MHIVVINNIDIMIHFQTSEMMRYHAEGLRIPPSIPSDRAFFPLDCPTFVFYYQC